jgi:glycine/D-amino acid oxidase-like deaminating enzyme
MPIQSRAFASIIGAGFFGVALADYLHRRFPQEQILVFDSAAEPLSRASRNNQARIHNGYHYPRSIRTALASTRSYEAFKARWPEAVFSDFTHLYAVARSGSHISSKQFEATMRSVGAPIEQERDPAILGAFDQTRIEGVYRVVEEAFNHDKLRDWALEVLAQKNVTFLPETTVQRVEGSADGSQLSTATGDLHTSKYLFNVTYSGIDSIDGLDEELEGEVIHQLTEMMICSTPSAFSDKAVTVMDGPFFSLMPWPTQPGTHSLSHVRYTPRLVGNKLDLVAKHYKSLGWVNDHDVFDLMRRDVERYIPALASGLKKVGEIREIKTLVQKNTNDSRPILFARHDLPGAYSILGGKIDNVFDMERQLDSEVLV